MTKKKFSPVGKNSLLTPEQITAYNTARTREWRQRKRDKLPEALRAKCRVRLELSTREQLDRLYKTINRPAMTYTVPPGEDYIPKPPVDPHSTEYYRLYDLARHTPYLGGKDKPNYVPRTTPYIRKPRRYGGRLGRPIKETRWLGTAPTIRPDILRKIKQTHALIPRAKPTIPRGTLTQTMLHDVLDYAPHLGEFYWIAGGHTGNLAGYERHNTPTRLHKGAKYPHHAPKRFPDPHLGLRPQRPASIITGRTQEHHPIDAHGNPICKPTKRLAIRTVTRLPDGTTHTEHDHHLVRPYNPMRVITVGGVTYPAWQLAILWMGAGYTFDLQYNSIPVPHYNDEPDKNTLLIAHTLNNKPAPPVFRDGNTLNLKWDNIRPDLAPIYPTEEMLSAAQAKFDKKYAKLKQQERTFHALSAENKRKAISDKYRKQRIAREKRQLHETTKYDASKCITETTFNKVQNKWIVAIPYQEKQVFFSEADAIAHHTQAIATLIKNGKITNTKDKAKNNIG
jgi:hypothetical protein